MIKYVYINVYIYKYVSINVYKVRITCVRRETSCDALKP